jgi:energy-coupling factor transporter ATP-binding protein EcfA2
VDLTRNDETLVCITGANGAGKTAVLLAVECALTGKKAEPDRPIREGANEARVTLTLREGLADRYSVEVVWTRKDDAKPERSLVVRDLGKQPAGGRYPRISQAPQRFLTELFGDIGIHPLDFVRADGKTQGKLILGADGLTEQYADAKAQITTAEEERKDRNKDVKRLRGVVASTPDPAPGEDLQPIDVAAVQTELSAAQAANTERAQRLHQLDVAKGKRDSHREEIARLERECLHLDAEIQQGSDWLTEHPQQDTETAGNKIKTSTEHNGKVRQQEAHRKALADLTEAEGAAESADNLVAASREALKALVASSDLGKSIEGLTLDEDGAVYLRGIPLKDCSGSEQNVIAAKVLMRGRTSGIIFIDEADGLGPEAVKALKSYAEQSGHEVWMTGIHAQDPATAQVVELSEGEVVNTGESK